MDSEKAERVIALLEEIRGLQQQHYEAYQTALRNQAEALAIQKKFIGLWMRAGLVLVIPIMALIVFLVFLLVSNLPASR